jgi:hypothetical protein
MNAQAIYTLLDLRMPDMQRRSTGAYNAEVSSMYVVLIYYNISVGGPQRAKWPLSRIVALRDFVAPIDAICVPA